MEKNNKIKTIGIERCENIKKFSSTVSSFIIHTGEKHYTHKDGSCFPMGLKYDTLLDSRLSDYLVLQPSVLMLNGVVRVR